MTCKRRGGDEQMFGANHQVPHAGGSYAAGLSPPLAARAAPTLNMSWHHPDLYIFLCLLAGIAALLAIIYEFCRRKPEQGDRPVYLGKAKPLDGLLRDRPSLTALNKRRIRWLTVVAVAMIAIGLVYTGKLTPNLAQSQAGVCAIKGNISSSGERI